MVGIAVELYRNDWLEKRSDDRNSLTVYPAAPRVLSRPRTHRYLVFLANRFDLPALAITETYRDRGQTELLFI